MTRKERIMARLQELGSEPKRSLGQNFLVSDQVVEKILTAAKSELFSEMVEVGPGLGALTEDLLTLGQPLTLVELDRRFAESWRGRATEGALLRVVEADALQIDWRTLNLPAETLFISNLPYQISSSVVVERSLDPAGVSRMVLMFQKEVAQRIMAQPRTKEYGLLTVIAQTFWDVKKVCDASPGDFFPSPNVSSRVLMFKYKTPTWLTPHASVKDFLSFAKAAFSQRRKLLTRNLYGSYFGGREGSLPQIESILKEQGFLLTARAEELDPKAFVRLYLSLSGLREA